MKFIASVLAIVLLSNVALAYNATYNKTAGAKETISITVSLPVKSIVRVEGTKQENISCVFFDKGTGNVAFESSNTTACVGHTSTFPAVIVAKITNNENKPADLQINVRDLP